MVRKIGSVTPLIPSSKYVYGLDKYSLNVSKPQSLEMHYFAEFEKKFRNDQKWYTKPKVSNGVARGSSGP